MLGVTPAGTCGFGVEWGAISNLEVVMRPPSVFVRPLLHEEAVRLKRLSRRAKHECTRQRAAVLLASNVRMPVPLIAEMWRTDPSWVRKVIHELAYPSRQRLYWIQDNLSANWIPAIRSFAAANKIELVATPTYASYLNPVECHFSALSQFVVCNADYLDWDAFGYALAHDISYRNTATATNASPPPKPDTESPHDITRPTQLQGPLAAF